MSSWSWGQKLLMKDETIDLSKLLPPTTVSGDSEVGRLLLDRGYPLTITRHRVFGGRDLARTVLEFLPEGSIILDCTSVDVMTPPFINELIKSRSDLAFTNMNSDVQASWDIAYEHLTAERCPGKPPLEQGPGTVVWVDPE